MIRNARPGRVNYPSPWNVSHRPCKRYSIFYVLTIISYLVANQKPENKNEISTFLTKNPKYKTFPLNSKIHGLAIGFQRLYVSQHCQQKATKSIATVIFQFDLQSMTPQTKKTDLTCSKTLCDILVLNNEKICSSDANKTEIWECNAQSKGGWRSHSVTSKSATLSKNCDGNILVSCRFSKQLLEFSPNLDTCCTPINLASQNITPSHAVKLSTGEFVVSDITGKQHRIIKLNSNGEIMCEYGGANRIGKGTKSLNMLAYLVRSKNDFILVADQNNDRILLMSPNLELVKELISPKYGLKKPFRMCLDEENERLFVNASSPSELLMLSFPD